MASLYANENFPLPVVQKLRSLGHDVLTIQETGNAGRAVPDNEVLEFAISESRAVITLNRRDFIEIHRRNDNHQGIIVCTVDPDSTHQANRIHQEILGRDSLAGELIRVNRGA